MSDWDKFMLFCLGCFVFGVLYRMAIGQSVGDAARNTFKAGTAPTRAALKVGHVGWKVWRRK